MVDLIRDGARWFRAQLPLLLPGFGAYFILSSLFGVNLGSGTFWGALLLLFFSVVAAALLGLLVQALRVVTFDFLRTLAGRGEAAPDAPHTARHALLANLATLWVVFVLVVLMHHWLWFGRGTAPVLLLVLFLLVGIGLVVGALRALRAPATPEPPARRTSRKKKTP